jgi:hypothetical protein
MSYDTIRVRAEGAAEVRHHPLREAAEAELHGSLLLFRASEIRRLDPSYAGETDRLVGEVS